MENNNLNPTGTEQNNRWLTAMFRDRNSAERAYQALHERGYTQDDVDLVMSDDTRKKYFDKDAAVETELGNKAMEGAGAGSAIGGTLGAIAGVIAAAGTSLLIPGLGLVIAGPLAAGLAGAGAGGLTGGIIGALIGRGIPEERAKVYDAGVRNGHIVMGVRPRTDEDAAYLEQYWRENEGQEVYR